MAKKDRPGGRLPRLPHADKPRPDEKVLKRSGADTALLAKRREIPLTEIRVIERFPLSPGTMPRGGRRPRMLLHTDVSIYELMVGDLDAWIDLLERYFQLRERRGDGEPPPIWRENHLNPLLMEE